MKKIFLTFLITTILFLGSCGGGGGGGEDDSNITGPLKMDIKDAVNLYIAKTSDSAKNKLFKITEDGHVEEVSILKTDKKGIPLSFIKLNNKYIFIFLGKYLNEYNYIINGKYIYNIETETSYRYSNPDQPRPYGDYKGGFRGEEYVCDANENFYFISHDGLLLKMDISNPQEIKLQSLLKEDERIWSTSWGVDDSGNIAYEATNYDNPSENVLRFRSTSGEYSNLPGSGDYMSTIFWKGLDGKLYYFNSSNPGEKIKVLNSNPFSADDCTSEANALDSVGGIENFLKTKNKNRMILIADGSYDKNFYEVYNPDTNTITKINAATCGLNSYKYAFSSDDDYYIVGTNLSDKKTLVKIDPITFAHEEMVPPGVYDIYAGSMNGTNIIFSAERISDGKKVIGKIASNKSVTILADNLSEPVTFIERIR